MMSLQRKRMVGLSLAIGLAGASFMALAQGMMNQMHDKHGGMMKQGMGPCMMMGEMPMEGGMAGAAMPEQHRARMQEMRELKGQMQALLAQDSPDPEQVGALHDRMAAAHRDMLVDCVRERGGSPVTAVEPAAETSEDDEHAGHH
ncbi:hypothetical protein CK507_17710 [Pseudomonas sp. WN033]|nr:hypothetical protein CK507_17710 [Pseudomonas sp. WN033]